MKSIDLQTMVNRGAKWLAKWLDTIETSKQADVNGLLGVAETAGLFARDGNDLEWAAISTRTYEIIASLTTDAFQRDSALCSSMTLRACLIAQMGAVSGDPLLDKEIILHWFNAEQKLSLEEAKRRSTVWATPAMRDGMSTDEIRELIREPRMIKNRLSVIKLLADSGHLTADSDLMKWLQIRDQLP